MSSSSAPTRRDARRRALGALLACASLGACGFQLRGAATYNFTSVYVNAGGHPAFAAELRTALVQSGGATLVDSAGAAEVVVDIQRIADDKQVLSLSPGGRVQEYELAKAIAFRVRDRDGRIWLQADDILIRRTYTYDDSQRLAREILEQRLQRDMQADAVAQIVRRLQAARPPVQPPA
jgi:LPS-assembly lipoprotein